MLMDKEEEDYGELEDRVEYTYFEDEEEEPIAPTQENSKCKHGKDLSENEMACELCNAENE